MCIFCKIINKEIPSEIIYEDDDLIFIKDINPAADIHLLGIPKKHIETINHLEDEDEELMGKLLLRIPTIAEELGFDDDGYKIVVNVGEGGGQSVFHIHFHILSGKINNFNF